LCDRPVAERKDGAGSGVRQPPAGEADLCLRERPDLRGFLASMRGEAGRGLAISSPSMISATIVSGTRRRSSYVARFACTAS
jgi:hypothetical protein